MQTENLEKVIVIDFGGQYNQLVARRVRECGVYCEIESFKAPLKKISDRKPKGIILTGGPDSVYSAGAASAPRELFELGIPVLWRTAYDASARRKSPEGSVAGIWKDVAHDRCAGFPPLRRNTASDDLLDEP